MDADAIEPWSGIADADAHLGGAVPLPRVPLPLLRWVEVRPAGPAAVEVEFNLDDTRPGTPGRLALYVGRDEPGDRAWPGETRQLEVGGAPAEHRFAALEEADASLRPAHELRWRDGDLHLRLTAQGPWELDELVTIAASVAA